MKRLVLKVVTTRMTKVRSTKNTVFGKTWILCASFLLSFYVCVKGLETFL